MKKYVSCFLFFFCLTSACLVGLFYVTGREEESREAMEVQMTESVDRPVFAGSEAESRPPGRHSPGHWRRPWKLPYLY